MTCCDCFKNYSTLIPVDPVISVICGKKAGEFVEDEHGGIR